MKSQTVGGLAIFALIVLGIVVSISEPKSIENEFAKWQNENGLRFDAIQYFYRFKIFTDNLKMIDNHNSKVSDYKLELNHFAHLTSSEFKHMFTNDRIYNDETKSSLNSKIISTVDEIDWEKQGKVTAVQAQGQCDAGYAFCTSSLLQSYRIMKNNTSQLLSKQQIIDCSGAYQTFGCKGGTRTGAIKYAQEKGLKVEKDYPYVGVQDKCKFQTGPNKLPAQIIQADGCDALIKQLQYSPLTIAVNTDTWQFYRSGVMKGCGSEVNHDVFLVGVYDAYWRVKNSWGVKWGQFGYIRIAIGDTCGICSRPGFGFK